MQYRLMPTLFAKRCTLCGVEAKNPVTRRVPLRGYSVDQKRPFCSEEHADHFESTMRKALKNRIVGCRTCYS